MLRIYKVNNIKNISHLLLTSLKYSYSGFCYINNLDFFERKHYCKYLQRFQFFENIMNLKKYIIYTNAKNMECCDVCLNKFYYQQYVSKKW